MAAGNDVWYIPDQVDSVGTSPPTARNNPLHLTFQDIRILVSQCPLILRLFRPLNTTSSTDELYMKGRNLCNVLACFVISLVELLLFPVVIVLCLAVPGIVALLVFILMGLLTWGVWAPFQGPDIIHCLPEGPGNAAAAREDETWVFINGILVTLVYLPPTYKLLMANGNGNPISVVFFLSRIAIGSRRPSVVRLPVFTIGHMVFSGICSNV